MCGPAPCDRPNCTWSPQHLATCEAREVMRWPGQKRAEYYADVKKRRGDAAAQELIKEVKKQWTNSQQQSLL